VGIGWHLPGRIMLQIDTRQLALRLAEDLILIFQVIFPRLEKNKVKLHVAYPVRFYFVYIFTPTKDTRSAAIPRRPTGFDRKKKLTGHLGQVVQVTTMDVPGKYA